MKSKADEKAKAIQLRKQGKTYEEIRREVPVAKSTLSLWLRNVKLSATQNQRFTARKRAAQLRGGEQRRQNRILQTNHTYKDAYVKIGKLSRREKFLIGVALYWAEGAKERGEKLGQGVDFCNTDPLMILFFIEWMRESFHIKDSDFRFSLYIHKNHRSRLDVVKNFWRKELGIKSLEFSYIYYKKHNPKTKRKKVGEDYFGTLRVQVRRSTYLQRRIYASIYGINGAPCPVV